MMRETHQTVMAGTRPGMTEHRPYRILGNKVAPAVSTHYIAAAGL